MADDINVTPGTGLTAVPVATDEIGGKHYPRGKVGFGVDGSYVDVSAANPLPVTLGLTDAQLRAAPVPVSGTVTVQDGGGSITVDGMVAITGAVGVTGTFWPTTQPVSAASLPLPSGAATEATLVAVGSLLAGTLTVQVSALPGGLATSALQGTANTSLASIDGKLPALSGGTVPVSLATAPLPSGGATAANQATANTSLASIDGKTPALGQALAAASVPVVLTAAQLTTLTPSAALTDAQLRATPVPVSSAPATSELHIGEVGSAGDLIDVTLSLDTVVYADGDVLADTQTITNAVRVTGGRAKLDSVQVTDEDDQGIGFDLVFFRANRSLGTENAAPSITDVNSRDCLGIVPVIAADYRDLGGNRVAAVTNIGLWLKAATGSRDLYVGAIIRGVGTYTAAGISLKLGFAWD